MAYFSRRRFLQFTGASALGALTPILSFDDVARAAAATPLPLGTPILVVVTLYGGNDGLNTVVPYQDPIYSSSRPGLSLSGPQVLPLGQGLALNASMKGMKALWDQQQLAIVLGVGYPQPNRSHFSSMAIWQTASPVEQVSSGWIGRWLDTQPRDPMRAIGIGSVLTPLLAGERRSASMLPSGGLVVPTGTLATQTMQLGQPSRFDSPIAADAASAIDDLYAVSSTVDPVLAGQAPNASNVLAQQLGVVASLIGANVPTRVWSVTLGGFDTHADELGQQTALLGVVSDAVAGFLAKVGMTSRANDVVVLVYSEFGRRVAANASNGTDHGTAGPVFVAGHRVLGGFYGAQPSLSQLVNGDLAVTTDFRDVYASMLEGVLGTDPSQVISGWNTKLTLTTSG